MKTYIKPATRWAEVEIEALIAQSPNGMEDGTPLNEELGEGQFSREYTSSSSLWDKEW